MSRTLETLLKDHGIPTVQQGQHHHATHGRINIDCPFCSPGSGRFRLGIHLTKYYCSCWRCGPHSLTETLSKATGLSYGALKGLLTGLTPTRSPERLQRANTLVLPGGRGPLHPVHKDYLSVRRFVPSTIVRLWGVEGIGIASRLQWRIFIPAYLDGNVVSWTTRSISDNVSAKYISAGMNEEAIPLKSILYGEQYCRNAVIVNEGPLDAWAIGPGAVATCGVGYSTAQLLRISHYPRRVILFDAEPEAQRRALRLCADLAVFEGTTINIELSTGKDASRASKKEIAKLREKFLE